MLVVFVPLLLIAGGMVVAVFVLARVHEKKREAAYRTAASTLGVEYLGDAPARSPGS